MKYLLIVPLLALSLVSNCYANNESVDKLFKAMNMDKQLTGGFEAMLPVIDQMSARFNLDAEAKKELINIYRTWFDKDIDRAQMLNKIKDIYASTFTSKELDKITEFFQSPVGGKYLRLSPGLMKQGAQIGMTEAQAKQTQLLNRLKPFFKKHNIK